MNADNKGRAALAQSRRWRQACAHIPATPPDYSALYRQHAEAVTRMDRAAEVAQRNLGYAAHGRTGRPRPRDQQRASKVGNRPVAAPPRAAARRLPPLS